MPDLTSRWSALLASGRAEWRAGMRDAVTGARLVDRFPFWWSDNRREWVEAQDSGRIFLGGPARLSHPDWSDGPTRGALLDQVRERWGDPYLSVVYCEPANPGQSEGWCVQPADNRLPIAGEDYESEAEALIAALEAAPEGV